MSCWFTTTTYNLTFPRQMRRIADFLAISVAPDLWTRIVAAASFEAMRRDGETLMSTTAAIFKNGSRSFFFKGAKGRWRGVANKEYLALYEAKAETMLSPACAGWVARRPRTGRRSSAHVARRAIALRDEVANKERRTRERKERFAMDWEPEQKFGVAPREAVEHLTGREFLQAVIDGRLPAPPIGRARDGFVVFEGVTGPHLLIRLAACTAAGP